MPDVTLQIAAIAIAASKCAAPQKTAASRRKKGHLDDAQEINQTAASQVVASAAVIAKVTAAALLRAVENVATVGLAAAVRIIPTQTILVRGILEK